MFVVGEDGNLKLLTQGSVQKASHQYMDKLHIFWPARPYQAVPAQVRILMQDHTIVPPRQHRESRSGHLSSSHLLKHRAPLHRQRPLIKNQLIITLKSGEAHVETPPMRVASSLWWPRPEHIHRIAPAGIPPSKNQKRPMLRHPMME
jgi:hypothetical protein